MQPLILAMVKTRLAHFSCLLVGNTVYLWKRTGLCLSPNSNVWTSSSQQKWRWMTCTAFKVSTECTSPTFFSLQPAWCRWAWQTWKLIKTKKLKEPTSLNHCLNKNFMPRRRNYFVLCMDKNKCPLLQTIKIRGVSFIASNYEERRVWNFSLHAG